MSGDDVIPFGQFKLYDRVVPPLYQGQYKTTLTQDLPAYIPHPHLTADRYFDITGPRWHLDPTAVHSMTPPDKEQDAITSAYVPMVVLQRRTLPWELDLFSGSPDMSPATGVKKSDYPSMALLLFTEDEITYNKEQPDEYIGIFKGADGIKLANITDQSTKVSGDSDESGIFSNAQATSLAITGLLKDRLADAVKVPGDTLQAVCPTLSEIRLLAHARQVNPMDKEQCGSDEDGWFSVVICNRLPTEPDTKYHACLVSLEGKLDDGFMEVNSALIEFNDEVPGGGGWITQASILDLPATLESLPDAGGDDEGVISELDKAIIKGAPDFIPSGGGYVPESANMGSTPRKRRWRLPKLSRKYLSLMSLLLAKGGGTSSESMAKGGGQQSNTMSSDPIKLVLLHHWTFKTSVTGGDYESRMKSLHLRIKDPGESKWERGELVKKVELLEFNTYCRVCEKNLGLDYQGDPGNYPPVPGNICIDCGGDLGQAHAEPMLLGNDMVRDVARNGYLTTEMTHSDGGVSDVVYRGPFIPLSVSHKPKDEPYFNSDQALALAVDIGGLFDISHASAFELGRLLALSDHSFTKAAARWRQTIYLGQQNKFTLDELSDTLPTLQGEDFNFSNLQSCILKTTTLSINQAKIGINNFNIQKLSQIDPNQPGFGVTDPSPQQFSRIADPQTESQLITETFSLGSSGSTGEIDALKQAYRTMTGQGEPE